MSSGNEEHGGMQAVLGEEEDHQSAGAQRHASSAVRRRAFCFKQEASAGCGLCCFTQIHGHGMAEEERIRPDRAHFQDVGSLVTLLLHTASVGVA